MKYQWEIKKNIDSPIIEELMLSLNISYPLAKILFQRGIKSFDEAKSFFRPNLEELHDPFLMKDMENAVNRLNESIANHEKIMIYGDYDVDGTTSVSLVYLFLKQFYQNLIYYIPDRYTEGYGVSDQGIEHAYHEGVSLIISLDCGIKAVQKVKKAKTLGIDFIICDHHIPGEELPDAIAILDPKQKDCQYPFKELCGCGVGFKLLQGWCEYNAIPLDNLWNFLDFVAIGTCADIVNVTGENRILIHYGMKMIQHNPRPGIKALLNVAGFIDQEISVSNIVFGVAPRINAAGRIEHAFNAVKLLIEEDDNEAIKLASKINTNNAHRQNLDKEITKQALEKIAQISDSSNATVLYDENWHKGVIGIVASRCIENYYKPTIILTKSGEFATGSARSVHGFDIYEAISGCEEFITQYGGHAFAAGLTLPLENIPLFQKKFEEVVTKTILPEQQIPKIQADIEVFTHELTYKLMQIIKQMAPFGPGNMQPIFVCKNVQLQGEVRLLKDEHIKMKITHNGSESLDCIGFGMRDYYEKLKSNKCFDICFSLEENTFRGVTNLQGMIRDIKFPDEDVL